MKRVITAIAAVFIFCITGIVNPSYAADNGTEFGVADDLTVIGVEGNYADPDVEIKGFTIFGSTDVSSPQIPAGAGNVVINGYLQVSSGTYFLGNSTFTGSAYFGGGSTFTAAGSIYINDGLTNQVLTKGSGGNLVWQSPSVFGDNLGNHIATKTLDMNGYDIIHIPTLSLGSSGSVTISTATTQFGGIGAGIYISTHAQIAGQIYVTGAATLANTLNVTGAATLNNDLTVAGNTTLNGNTTIGDQATDGLTINPTVIKLGQISTSNTQQTFYTSDGSTPIAWFKKK